LWRGHPVTEALKKQETPAKQIFATMLSEKTLGTNMFSRKTCGNIAPPMHLESTNNLQQGSSQHSKSKANTFTKNTEALEVLVKKQNETREK
jgi:hypothetical protein